MAFYNLSGGGSEGTPSPNVGVWLNQTPLDVTRWQWPLYRGSDATPVIVPMGAGRLKDEFAKLQFGPHKLRIMAPEERGDAKGKETTIEHVYLDYVEATTETAGLLRLYDYRYVMRAQVMPFDVNVVRPINPEKAEATDDNEKVYREDTSPDARTAATLDWAVKRLVALLAPPPKVTYGTGANATAVLPDNLLLSNAMRLNEALGLLCELTGHDFTIDTEGGIVIVAKADETVPGEVKSALWLTRPELDGKAWAIGAPKAIHVLVQRRYELILDLPQISGSVSIVQRQFPAGTTPLDLVQVYEVGGQYFTPKDFHDYIVASFTAYGFGTRPVGTALFSDAAVVDVFDAHITDDEWLGTFLQVRPSNGFAANQRQEANAASMSRAFIDVIRRDHRKLYRMQERQQTGSTIKPIQFNAWYDYHFGVMDAEGQLADFVTRGSDRIGPVNGDWCELLQQYVATRRNGDGTRIEADLGMNHRSTNLRPSPFAVGWDKTPAEAVIRLTPLAPLQASPIVGLVANRFPGQWGTLPTLREQTSTDLVSATDYGAATDLRVLVTGQRGALDNRITAHIRLVATQRSPNTIERFEVFDFDTGIKEATRELVEVSASPDLSLALLADGSELNRTVVEADAKAQADEVIRAYKLGAFGVGVAHGTQLVRRLKAPVGAVQRMAIVFGTGSHDYFIGTQVDIGPASYADRLAATRRKALAEQAKQSYPKASKEKPAPEPVHERAIL